jgi:diacylglycerol kinase family enzyme
MKVLIINNLRSGLQDGSIFEFMRKLAQDGDELVLRNTDGHTEIEPLLADTGDCDFVVASGGDGTISAVCYALRSTGIPILPFPAGTGNLLVTNLDQPEEPYALVEMLREGLFLDFDMGELTFEKDGVTVQKGFSVIAGAGYDATIMKSAERLKEAFGPGAYIAAALNNPTPTSAAFTLRLDDRVVETEGIAVLILNFAKIYPDVSITHDNDARDGLLEVAVLKPQNAVELLPAFFAAFLDRAGGFPYRTDAIELFKTKSLLIEADPALYLQYDGETPDTVTPLGAQVLPKATRLIVTKREYERLS